MSASVAVLLMLLVGLAFGGNAAGAVNGACDTTGKRVLLSNGVVVVYREPPESAGGGEAYSCVKKTGNRVQLDEPPEGTVVFPKPAMAVAGYKLAYVEDTLTNESAAATRVWIIDTREPDLQAQQDGTNVMTEAKVGSLVLAPSGAAAWTSCDVEQTGDGKIGRRCSGPGALDRVYRLAPGSRKPRRLDKGRDIDPSSLRRRGQRVSWVAGGRTHSAVLP